MRGIMIYKMKKLITAILFLILSSPLCFSLSDFHFSIEPRISLSYGELNELLYSSDGNLVSQLDWEQKPLFYYGLEADITLKNFRIITLFESSLPVGTSYMYDYDDFDGNGTFDKLSKHPIDRTINFNTELTFSYNLQLSSAFTIIPLLHFQYLFNKFEADKGLILFGQRTQGKTVYANKIDYLRHSFFIFSGISLKISPLKKSFFTVDFLISPWGYQYAIDYHHGSGKDPRYPFSTYDYIYSYFSKFKFNVSANCIINSFFSIQVFTSFLFGSADNGYFYTDYESDELYLSSQKSGAKINYIKTGLSLRFNF